jgi:predicted type IV restriction endonuclease
MGEFDDKIRDLAARIPSQREHIRTEEACKSALVMPFINALGFNVFDPREVTPELVADVGTKKGEKVDYAILRDGKPIMLFECKTCGCDLDSAHASQLYRYFSVTDARFGILTNGIQYRFYSDLDAPNKMDAKPFLEIDMLSLDDIAITELARFSKAAFDVSSILATASELKYMKEIKRVLASEMQKPSEDLVRFFLSRVYEGRATTAVREQFSELVRRSLAEFISDRVRERLQSALANESARVPSTEAQTTPAEATEVEEKSTEPTDEEKESWMVIRAILAEVMDPRRVAIRDQQSYCAILFDDNNRRPICRLHFNARTKRYVGFFDESRTETKVLINDVSDLYKHAALFRATAQRYLGTQHSEPVAEAS